MKLSDLNTTLGNRDSTSGVRLSDYVYGGVNIPDVKLNADTGLTVASSKKLYDATKWEPHTTLEEGLKETINWWKLRFKENKVNTTSDYSI